MAVEHESLCRTTQEVQATAAQATPLISSLLDFQLYVFDVKSKI